MNGRGSITKCNELEWMGNGGVMTYFKTSVLAPACKNRRKM
jgi:hypothetical protein